MEYFETVSQVVFSWKISVNVLAAPERTEFVDTSIFEFQGHHWKLRFYPTGCKDAMSGSCSLYLILQDGPLTVSINGNCEIFLQRLGQCKKADFKIDKQTKYEGRKNFCYASELSKFVFNDMLQIGVKMPKKKLGLNDFALSITQELYRNSGKGDTSILCSDEVVVKADKLVLRSVQFFSAFFDYEDCKRGNGDLSNDDSFCTIKLENFKAKIVNLLIQFIYTGMILAPETIEERCELYCLAHYTSNNQLCDFIYEEITKSDICIESILEILLFFRSKALPLRDRAIEFYHQNRPDIIELENFGEWRDVVISDVEFLNIFI